MSFKAFAGFLAIASSAACAASINLLEPDPGPAKIEYYGEGGIAALRFAHTVDSATGVVSAGATELCEILRKDCVFPGVVIRTLTAGEVDALFRDAASAEFASLNREYVPDNICCDRRDHHILVRANGFKRTVRWFDGVDMPAVLERVAQKVFAAGSPQ
ncbi:MAG: hypothetical protein AB1762_01365 [Gemmatimonadota bacterium]